MEWLVLLSSRSKNSILLLVKLRPHWLLFRCSVKSIISSMVPFQIIRRSSMYLLYVTMLGNQGWSLKMKASSNLPIYRFAKLSETCSHRSATNLFVYRFFQISNTLCVNMKWMPRRMKLLCAGVMVASSVRYLITHLQPFSWGILE